MTDTPELEQSPSLRDRRAALKLLGVSGLAVAVAACAPGAGGPPGGPGGGGAGEGDSSGDGGSCSRITEETAGPFPGDGSNGPEVLTQSGVVRSDIRSSFGAASGVATGVPFLITLTVVDITNGCAPAPGRAVYVWHCDALGRYSLYSPGITSENYLRGVQVTDADGQVTFQSIVPGCYSGRWPHVHFEVYPSLDSITSAANSIATSQLALPQSMCDAVFATSGYPGSAANLSHVTLATDGVFSNGAVRETPVVTGDVTSGYTSALTAPA
jgi:protocatechuate 3,4-dioxygenase beta subunit